jgi:hydrogenase maturation factor
MKIKQANGATAVVLRKEKELEVKTPFLSGLLPGDWVLVNANLALKKISEKEAEEIMNYYQPHPSSP